MPPKNQSKEKAPRRERAKQNILVGLGVGLAIVGVSKAYDGGGSPEGGHTTSGPSQRSKGNSIFCSDPSVVEKVSVSAGQIKSIHTEGGVAGLHGIHKVDGINKVEFSYDHDVVKNVQEAWDFRDAVYDYFNKPIISVPHHAGAAAVGEIAVYKCQ